MKWINVDLDSAKKLIERLTDRYGYEMIQVEDGCLGLGKIAMLPTRQYHYIFLIREVYLNEWSSGHQYMKCRKMPKEWDKRIAQLEDAD